MAVTPAGAEVSNAVATSWKKIWKKNLKPLADKRYYTKAQSDAKYQPKGSYEPAGSGYTKAETYSKAEADAKYAAAGSGYSKAESDGRYARSTSLVRGSYMILNVATAANQFDGTDISFGTTFASAPEVHIIPVGGVPPAGCSGSVTAPDASPGHLCVFASLSSNAGTVFSCKASTSSCFGTASDPWGATLFTTSNAAGSMQAFGTWAARPTAVVATAPGRVSPGSGSTGSDEPLGTGATR
ncbi:hypothetical protein SAMN05192575_101354 [Nocardioides alpinus]|uniref:Uncharacterized protein n=1 Tax=Nocardioides alpinus TaxID=748909 RepID=A0A1I0VP78_9ACTN|nr:hypothetical protein [Nocardioides alpinus]PKH37385.1 hypothetical protein CXG46_18175 [Nocardioides alpinus]SFA78121.1 hypothetical protein SAMN05192575_101354 [Nocardioides alpinus]